MTVLLSTSALGAGKKPQLDDEARAVADKRIETRDARMQWWRDAKFGMFVHWGVYSVPAGTYKGKQIGGIGEWIMHNAKIPVAEYREFAKQFNPAQFDADEWVRVAKDAGMKYIVITSKHHDGFAMYHSKHSEWDIDEAAPKFKRDPIDELVKACRKNGIKIGLYYSHCWDWTHPGGGKGQRKGDGGEWDDAQKGTSEEYFKTIALPQVREVLTRFKPDIIWFDTPIGYVDVNETVKLLALQPDIICNGRLCYKNGELSIGEDYAVEERSVPNHKIDHDWETCATINGTWGYKSYDTKWKTHDTFIKALVKCSGGGGNYLLNVGPDEEGIIPEGSVKVLNEVGKWLKRNGKSIYGTRGGPFAPKLLLWGSVTQKGKKLYLHITNKPEGSTIDLPGLKTKINRIYAFADASETCSVSREFETQYIDITGIELDPIDTILVAELAGEPQLVPVPARASKDGAIRLHPRSISFGGGWVKPGKDNVYIWTQPDIWLKWLLEVKKAGKYEVSITYATTENQAGQPFQVDINGEVLRSKTIGTDRKPKEVPVGRIGIAKTGNMNLTFKPGADVSKDLYRQPMMNILGISLKPVE
jgi:alpha-L-fucosidase